ncbi:MAG: hypothetical protein AAF936_15615 [Pseudomonadota bacterium]
MDENEHSSGKANERGPVDVASDGAIRSPIFRHESKYGPRFSTTVERRWRDGNGNWHTSHSFSETEALRASEVLREARQRIIGLRHEQKQIREAADDARGFESHDESRDKFEDRQQGAQSRSNSRSRTTREAPRER